MSLRERVGSWLLGPRPMERASTEAIDFNMPAAANFGPGIGNQPSHAALLRESLGIADTATRAIANRISGLEPQVKVKRRIRDGTQVEEVLDDHRLKALLDRPHPTFTRSQLLRLTAQYIVTVGEAYWLKVGDGLGLPAELHPIPPAQVRPLVLNNAVTSYELRDGNGRPTIVPADTVCRFFFPDPENMFGSEGYLGPEGVTADSLKFSGQHLRHHYQHNATPPSVLETGADATAFNDVEAKRFNHEWIKRNHARAGMGKGGPQILPLGYKLVQMAMQSGADITPLLEFWRDEQLMGFGTPRSVLGQVVSGDRSSAETNQYVFDRHAVLPIANLIADTLTLQVASDFDTMIFVTFEDFVSADKEFELKQEVADLTGKVRSVDQVREDRGLDTVPWGEQPVATIGEQPYDPEGFFELPPDMPGALGDEPEEPDGPRSTPAGSAGLGVAEDIQKSLLNGAQVTSMVQIVTSVAAGELPRESGLKILETAFGITAAEANDIMSGAGRSRTDTGRVFWRTARRAFFELPDDNPGALGDDEGEDRVFRLEAPEEEPGYRSGLRAFFTPANEWQRQVRREKKFVPAFLKAMRSVFRDQSKLVLAALEDTGGAAYSCRDRCLGAVRPGGVGPAVRGPR